MLRLACLLALSLVLPAPRNPLSCGIDRARERQTPPLLALLPDGCRVSVDAGGLAEVVANGLEDPLLGSFLETDLGRLWTHSGAATPQQAVAALERWLGPTPLAALHELVGAGLAFGWYGEPRRAVVIGRGQDPERASTALDRLLSTIGRESGYPKAFERPHDRWGTARVWHAGEAWIVSDGALWIVGQSEELVREALERGASTTPDRPLERPQDRPAGRAARGVALWADLETLANEGAQGILDLRRGSGAPPFHFLLGSDLAALAGARQILVELDLGEEGLSLSARGVPDASRRTSPGSSRVPPSLAGPDDLGTALVHRDLAGIIGRRVELFPPTSLPGFAEALGNAALFFGGRDVERDVLPALSPWWRLIVRQPAFDPRRAPEIPLPGLVVIVPVRSQETGEDWISAFQTLLAIRNVEEAQKGRASLRLGLEQLGEVTLTSARLPDLREGEHGDLGYNLEPAAATTEGLVLMSTHVSLLRDVLGRLAEAPEATQAAPRESLALDTRALADLVARQREILELRQRLEEGGSPEEARAKVELVRALLASLGEMRLQVEAGEQIELRLDVRWAHAFEAER